jgi:hypothetical protein
MAVVDNIFGITSAEFYESLYVDLLGSMLPAGWQLFRSDFWLHARPRARPLGRTQGFKLHLSCAPDMAKALLEIAVPVCVVAGVELKIAADPRLHALLVSKQHPRGQSGKFMTVYPPDDATFRALAQELSDKTSAIDFQGPFILSDRRYRESKVVYYRYGGFQSPYALGIDGTRTPCLIAPDGSLVPDRRLPSFQLPSWVSDPFDDPPAMTSGAGEVLGERFLVEGAFSFSNSGGVYYGRDLETERRVVIKEARPFTNRWSIGAQRWDATHLLRHEHRALERLRGLSLAPEPLASFGEWEHEFLVEERLAGMRLSEFWATRELPFAPHVRNAEALRRFLPAWVAIARQLIEKVSMAHDHGVLLGDLSPRNVLIDPEDLSVRLIDFESSMLEDDPPELMAYACMWGTPGFVSPARSHRSRLLPEDDFYALAMVLCESIVPVNDLATLDPGAPWRFLDRFVELGLPPAARSIVASLAAGDAGAARRALDDLAVSGASMSDAGACSSRPNDPSIDLDGLTASMAAYVVAKTDPSRDDRLWPSHFTVFSTNPLSIAYGACGTSLFLRETSGELPHEVLRWIVERRVDDRTYPPGLFLGSAGVAYALLMHGATEEAEAVMARTYASPMRYDEPGVFLGSAGWGLVSLCFFHATGNEQHRDQAVEAGLHLRRTVEPGGAHWLCRQDGLRHHGYGWGSSGIALFLLYLYEATAREEFLELGLAGLESELAAREPGPRYEWRRYEGDSLLYPYWIHGNAGIASVALRFSTLLGERRYERLALDIVDDTFVKYSYTMGLFEGLAGIGELMLDAFLATGDEGHRRRAMDIAETITWFGLERPEGVAFPGRWLHRISTDYATGAAGIGLFLRRLARGGGRHFLDLNRPGELTLRSPGRRPADGRDESS